MDLHHLATEDSIDAVTVDDIRTWASHYLPEPSANKFADWINVHDALSRARDIAKEGT